MTMGRLSAAQTSGSNRAVSAQYLGSSSNRMLMTASQKRRKGAACPAHSFSAVVAIFLRETRNPLFSPCAQQ